MFPYFPFILYSIITSHYCYGLICPPWKILNGCDCTPSTQHLSCRNKEVPKIENIFFLNCDFYDVVSKFKYLNNVTCDELRLQGKSTEISFIEPLFQLNFTTLKLWDLDMNLILRIFERKYEKVTMVSIMLLKVDKLDLNFQNFPNLKSIIIGGTRLLARLTTVGSHVFSKLKNLKSISLKYANVKYLEQNSLMLSSNNRVQLSLDKNEITLDEFERSNLSNPNGFDVNLSNNKISKFPEQVFKKYCDSSTKIRISLAYNPIVCEPGEINWIFEYKYMDRISDAFPLKNVYCVNHDNKDLLFMDESDFNYTTISPTLSTTLSPTEDTTTISVTTTAITTSTVNNSTPNDEEVEELTPEEKALREWPFIILLFVFLLILSCSFYLIYKRKCIKIYEDPLSFPIPFSTDPPEPPPRNSVTSSSFLVEDRQDPLYSGSSASYISPELNSQEILKRQHIPSEETSPSTSQEIIESNSVTRSAFNQEHPGVNEPIYNIILDQNIMNSGIE